MILPAQDHAAALRCLTWSILTAAGTDAGDRVEQERIDPVQDGDVPRLVIFMDQSGQTDSPAGGPPRFTVTAQLTIQALVQDARLPRAVIALDRLVAQTKYVLLCNPDWVRMATNIQTIRVTNSFKGGGDLITGDARIQITMTWWETYAPDTVALSGIDMTGTIGAGHTLYSSQNLRSS